MKKPETAFSPDMAVLLAVSSQKTVKLSAGDIMKSLNSKTPLATVK